MQGNQSLDWEQGFVLDFSLLSGMSKSLPTTQRKLSQMQEMYADKAAAQQAVEQEDPVVYEFYELDAPISSGDLAFGTSITYAGKVGKEYYMTKGHFHTILNTAEVYYVLSGEGYMLSENTQGNVVLQALEAGKALYVPKGYAHRTINTGKAPLVTFFVFRADAGHDYGSIEKKGYRKLLIEGEDGTPQLIDNPKWK